MFTKIAPTVVQRISKVICAGLLPVIVLVPSVASGDRANDSEFTSPEEGGSIVSLSSPSVSEGDGSAEVTVMLTPVSTARVVAAVYTRPASATRAEDFYGVFERIVFEPGESEKSLSVTIIDDNQSEEEEKIEVNLGAVEGATAASGSAFITIQDDDGEPTRFLSIRDVDTTEFTPVTTVVVLLDKPSIHPVSVIVHTRPDGTAKPGADFYGLSETVTFAPGEVDKYPILNIIDDDEQEETETLTLRLAQPTGAQIADGVASVVITDNDQPVELSLFDLKIGERVGVARITARLSRPSTDVVKATVISQAGTAIDGLDYIGIESTLVFQPGEIFQPVLVTIINDQETESPESFTLNLVDVENAQVLDGTSTVTILDSD